MVHNRIRKIESAGKNSGAATKLFMGFCIPRLALSKNIPLELMCILSFWGWTPYDDLLFCTMCMLWSINWFTFRIVCLYHSTATKPNHHSNTFLHCRLATCIIIPDQFFPQKTPYQGSDRVFGRFQCAECDHRWSSCNSWANSRQRCTQCGIMVYPYSQEPLNPSAIHNILCC